MYMLLMRVPCVAFAVLSRTSESGGPNPAGSPASRDYALRTSTVDCDYAGWPVSPPGTRSPCQIGQGPEGSGGL